MKRMFLTMIALFMLSATGFAQSGTTGPLTWDLSNGTLTISGTGAMPYYGPFSAPWYSYNSSITTVIIGDGVTSIGDWAFYYCNGLTSVTIGNSVTSIGYGAFYECSSLASVTIGNSVTSIGSSAFSNCRGLTSVTIPNSVTGIGDGAFFSCSALTAIDVSEDNTAYASENGVLFNKAKSNLIQYPAGKQNASYTIPSSVTSIGYGAFEWCSKLTSITIGNSVTSIGEYAFRDCSALTAIDVSEDNTAYASENGVLFNKAKSNLIRYPEEKQDASYTIPNSAISIRAYAFHNCSTLTSVTIPNSVTSIGIYAFRGCYGLTSITIPNSVTSVGDLAFSGCSALTAIDVSDNNTAYASENGVLLNKAKSNLIKYPAGKQDASYNIPNSVTSIEDEAFYECSSLASVTIPNSVTSIGIYAFRGCYGLTSITIPNSVTSIGDFAFYSCTELTSVTNLNSTPQSIRSYVFSSVTLSDATLYVPEGSKELYKTSPIWKDFGSILEIPSLHWQADYQSFQSTMTFTSAVVLNGTELQSPTIEIGAFSGDECRGSARLKNFPEVTEHPYQAFLTVHGDGDETITLRVYNHETGEEYEVTNAPVTFVADAIYGNPAEPYTVNITDRQAVNLSEGWNWISVNIANDNPSLIDQFKENINGGVMLKGRNEYIQAPGWIGTLYEIGNESMYMVNTTVEQTLQFVGAQVNPAEVPIPLLNGWNWIGYTPGDASTISEALAGLNPQIDDQIKSYSDYSVYTEQGWTGSLSSLLPGNGYKYYSGNAAPQTLTYSEPAPQNAPPMYGSPAATPDRQWTAATHKYPNNMTVTSVVVLDDVELSGNIEIGAFCGDECRGATLLRNIPTIAGRSTMGFLVIYGNSNEEISLRIYDHVTGAEYQVAAPLLFVSDAIHGVPGNPYRILATATGIDKITTGESIDIIEVIDLNGRSLLKKTGATLQSINNSSLSTGIYLLKITQNGQTSVKKFIKH